MLLLAVFSVKNRGAEDWIEVFYFFNAFKDLWFCYGVFLGLLVFFYDLG
jgi:hypothetical protein